MGMESWFRENMPYQVEQYGINLEDTNIQLDAPTSDTPFGFTSGYDPKYKRILVTKKEMLPTDLFLSYVSDGLVQTVRPDKEFLQENFTAEDVIYTGVLVFVIYDSAGNPVDIASFDNSDYFVPGGWTLSYYPELETWGSRHSYLPKMYASTPENFYSFDTTTMWEHSNNAAPGSFYGTTYPFEFCLLYTSPSPRDATLSRMPSSA